MKAQGLYQVFTSVLVKLYGDDEIVIQYKINS